MAEKKKVTKKKTAKKRAKRKSKPVKAKKKKKLTKEEQARADYEKKNELAPYVGYDAYLDTKNVEERIKSIGILGSMLRGQNRTEVRKAFRLSPRKFNKLLTSEHVEDVLAYSIGYLYSLQSVAVKAIHKQIEEENDGRLAMDLLERLGTFEDDFKVRLLMEGMSDKEKATPEEALTRVLAEDTPKARQIKQELATLVEESFKKGSDNERRAH